MPRQGTFNNGKARYRRLVQSGKQPGFNWVKRRQKAIEIEQQAQEERFRLKQKDAADGLRRSVLGPVEG